MSYSAVYGAMMSYNTANNSDVPYLYPSNRALNVEGAVLSDGNGSMIWIRSRLGKSERETAW